MVLKDYYSEKKGNEIIFSHWFFTSFTHFLRFGFVVERLSSLIRRERFYVLTNSQGEGMTHDAKKEKKMKKRVALFFLLLFVIPYLEAATQTGYTTRKFFLFSLLLSAFEYTQHFFGTVIVDSVNGNDANASGPFQTLQRGTTLPPKEQEEEGVPFHFHVLRSFFLKILQHST